MPLRRALAAPVLLLCFAGPAWAADPLVGVWYRGTPAGTPRQDELAVIRALGFGGVTWPASQTSGAEALRRMATAAGLQVTIAVPPKGATPASALIPSPRLDLIVTPQNADAVTAIAWRAVAHGARTLMFDSGSPTGAGLENPDRSLKPWVRAAQSVARQFDANSRLITALRPGPGVTLSPDRKPDLDVVMLDADRSWVLIVTNTSAAQTETLLRLPTGTPYAIWFDMLDASTLAMNGSEAAGPKSTLRTAPHTARVYVIDKVMK